MVRSLLGQVFDTAIRHDAIARNPAKGYEGHQPGEEACAGVEYGAGAAAACVLYWCTLGLDVLVEILLGTGARIGEALGMCWEDLERRGDGVVWHVAGTVIRDSGRVYKQNTASTHRIWRCGSPSS